MTLYHGGPARRRRRSEASLVLLEKTIVSECCALYCLHRSQVDSLAPQFTLIEFWCMTNRYRGFESINNRRTRRTEMWRKCSFLVNKRIPTILMPFQKPLTKGTTKLFKTDEKHTSIENRSRLAKPLPRNRWLLRSNEVNFEKDPKSY